MRVGSTVFGLIFATSACSSGASEAPAPVTTQASAQPTVPSIPAMTAAPVMTAAPMTTSTGTPMMPSADDKAKNCASAFGNALTNAFGRVDGTVVAVVPPGHPTCALPNRDHLVVQVSIAGDVYRMVANVKSDIGDPNVKFQVVEHALFAPAWSEGWHAGVKLDYIDDFGLHSTTDAWKSFAMDPLVARVTDELTVGAHVSVYSTSSGGSSSHLVHRNKPGADGAIVVNPDDAKKPPRFLLFSFADQMY